MLTSAILVFVLPILGPVLPFAAVAYAVTWLL
ncbi:MAG: hypothetical protein ACI9U2_004992 [Bradymonadia bacterium]|jgi:hypothetical protein